MPLRAHTRTAYPWRTLRQLARPTPRMVEANPNHTCQSDPESAEDNRNLAESIPQIGENHSTRSTPSQMWPKPPPMGRERYGGCHPCAAIHAHASNLAQRTMCARNATHGHTGTRKLAQRRVAGQALFADAAGIAERSGHQNSARALPCGVSVGAAQTRCGNNHSNGCTSARSWEDAPKAGANADVDKPSHRATAIAHARSLGHAASWQIRADAAWPRGGGFYRCDQLEKKRSPHTTTDLHNSPDAEGNPANARIPHYSGAQHRICFCISIKVNGRPNMRAANHNPHTM